MLDSWLFVGMIVVVGVLLPAAVLVFARLVAPHKPNKMKLESYECGMETVGNAWVQFKVQYYIYALVFLVFDVEVIFLYPWAVAYHKLPFLGVMAGILFVFLLGDGLIYAWKKGALEWS